MSARTLQGAVEEPRRSSKLHMVLVIVIYRIATVTKEIRTQSKVKGLISRTFPYFSDVESAANKNNLLLYLLASKRSPQDQVLICRTLNAVAKPFKVDL